MKIERNACYNIDCKDGMELMLQQGLKADWCITDPPYGISADEGLAKKSGTQFGKAKAKSRTYKKTDWDKVRIGGVLRLNARGKRPPSNFWRQLLYRLPSTYKKLVGLE